MSEREQMSAENRSAECNAEKVTRWPLCGFCLQDRGVSAEDVMRATNPTKNPEAAARVLAVVARHA